MFTKDNTEGFSADEIKLCNEAAAQLMRERGLDEKEATDVVNNNWREGRNTLTSLVYGVDSIADVLAERGLSTDNTEHLSDPCYGVREEGDHYRLALDAAGSYYVRAELA